MAWRYNGNQGERRRGNPPPLRLDHKETEEEIMVKLSKATWAELAKLTPEEKKEVATWLRKEAILATPDKTPKKQEKREEAQKDD